MDLSINYEDIVTWQYLDDGFYSGIDGKVNGTSYEISFGGNLNNLIYKSQDSSVSINET